MFEPQVTFKSALWNHVGKVLEYFLMYATSILIARGLGVQENGSFVGLFSVSQLLLVLSSFGLEVSLNKHIPQVVGKLRIERLRHILRRAFALRVLAIFGCAIAVFAAVRLLPQFIPALLPEYIWLLIAYTAVRSIVSLFASVLTAELQTRATSIINVFARAVELLLIGLLASRDITTSGVFVVFLSTAFAQLLAYAVVARQKVFGTTERVAILPIVVFGGIYWTNIVVEYFLGRQGDVLILTMLLPDSTQPSLYDVAFAVSQLASLSMTLGLGGITLATFAKLALRDSQLLERFYAFLIRMTSLLSVPLYAFILFNAESVLSVLYSSRYLPAAGLIQGIAAFRIIGRLFGGPENAEFLLSRSKVSTLVAIGIVGAVVNVALDILLIPLLGASGAVIGSGLGNITVNVLGALAVFRNSALRIQWRFWLKVVVATSLASYSCSMLIPHESFVMVCVQVAMYAIMTATLFVVLRPLTWKDGEWLRQADSPFAFPLRQFVQKDSNTVGAKLS
jgi:O-antigen/teichoic acid export membrane protein